MIAFHLAGPSVWGVVALEDTSKCKQNCRHAKSHSLGVRLLKKGEQGGGGVTPIDPVLPPATGPGQNFNWSSGQGRKLGAKANFS